MVCLLPTLAQTGWERVGDVRSLDGHRVECRRQMRKGREHPPSAPPRCTTPVPGERRSAPATKVRREAVAGVGAVAGRPGQHVLIGSAGRRCRRRRCSLCSHRAADHGDHLAGQIPVRRVVVRGGTSRSASGSAGGSVVTVVLLQRVDPTCRSRTSGPPDGIAVPCSESDGPADRALMAVRSWSSMPSVHLVRARLSR
jgi:hypothetical protein